jgi:hypothetical protein
MKALAEKTNFDQNRQLIESLMEKEKKFEKQQRALRKAAKEISIANK